MRSFIGKKILVFTAHPDDESYLAAGSIYKNYKAGGTTILVCASSGEKGMSHLTEQVSRAQLKKMRTAELQKAKKVLHISSLHLLGLPDGQLQKSKKKMLAKTLHYVKKYKPEVIVSFGRDGITGHLDHIAVGNVARTIADLVHVPLAAFTLPSKVKSQAITFLRTRRHSKHYTDTVQYAEPTLSIMINTSIKEKALACHATQMDNNKVFTGFPAFTVKELLRAEHFIFDSNTV